MVAKGESSGSGSTWSLAFFVHIPGEEFRPLAHLTGLVNLPTNEFL